MAAEPGPTAGSASQAGVHTRRRGETLERAIFAAAIDELQRVGLSGLTMEGVAACAHTGKAALYRRWPGKEDLVVDALDHALPSADELPDHGDVRDDLLDLLRHMAAMMNSPTGCAMQALSAEVGPAMVAQRFMADGGPVPDAYVVSVVDDVVMPMLRP